jgi:hypothetical protein
VKATYAILLLVGTAILALLFANGNFHMGQFYHQVVEPAGIWLLIGSIAYVVLFAFVHIVKSWWR